MSDPIIKLYPEPDGSYELLFNWLPKKFSWQWFVWKFWQWKSRNLHGESCIVERVTFTVCDRKKK